MNVVYKIHCLKKYIFDKSFCVCLLLILTTFVSTPFVFPFFIERWYPMIDTILISISFFLVSHYYTCKSNFLIRLLTFLLFFEAIRCILISIIYNDVTGSNIMLVGLGIVLKYILYIMICIVVESDRKMFLNLLWKLLILMVVLSFPLFLLILFNGIDVLPHLELYRYGFGNNCCQRLYCIGGSNAIINISGFDIIRVAGFCDEPGAFALILTNMLVLNELTYKSNLYRIIILFAGLLTFSMAFIVTLLPIILYWVVRKCKFIYIIILIVCLFILGNINTNSPAEYIVDKLIFNRFDYNDNGTISGDNRYIYSQEQKEIFWKYPWFGALAHKTVIDSFYYLEAPTIYSFIAQRGILGIFVVLPFVYVLVLYRKKFELLLFLSLFLNFFQRPGFTMLQITFIILYYYIYMNDKITQKYECHFL